MLQTAKIEYLLQILIKLIFCDNQMSLCSASRLLSRWKSGNFYSSTSSSSSSSSEGNSVCHIPVSPEIYNHALCLAHTQDKMIVPTPADQEVSVLKAPPLIHSIHSIQDLNSSTVLVLRINRIR